MDFLLKCSIIYKYIVDIYFIYVQKIYKKFEKIRF